MADKEAWQANQERLMAERKFLTDEQMEGMTDKEAFHKNYNFPDSLEYMGEEEELADLRNDPSMQGLLKYNYADPDATGVAHDNIDEILTGNRQEKLEKDIAMHGSIGPTPFIQSNEGQQALLDMVTGSPGGAIGRVAKGAITGGQLSRTGKAGKDFYHRLLKDMSPKEFVERADWDEQLSNARKLMEKALDKFGVRHTTTVNDPITEILRSMKGWKN